MRITAVRAGMLFVFFGVLALMVTALPGFAAGKPVAEGIKKDLRSAWDKMEKACPDEHVFIERMKKAGASYFPELAAPTARAQSYTDPEKQRLMVGVYLVDMAYAVDFGKNKESLNAGEAVDALLTKLGYNDPAIVRQYKKTVKDAETPNVKRGMIDLDKTIEKALPRMIDNEEGLELAVEAAYGWLVEVLYLTTETVAQKNYDPKFLALLNEQKKSVKVVMDILDVFKNNKELAGIVERGERMPLLQNISKKMKSPKEMGKDDVEAIRGMVAKARAEIVR